MASGQRRFFQASEFAERAGVTVRTLHHYDQLGLLKPSGRSDAGYRLYGERDLARLEQIVMLKLLGLPLGRIKTLLDENLMDLAQALRFQKTVLEEKRQQLDRALRAINEAARLLDVGQQPGWEILKEIIESMETQNDVNWMMKYYEDETRAKVEQRKALWNPELQAKVSQQWADLTRDIEAHLDVEPGSEKAQKLATRWKALVAGFTGGDARIQAGLNAMYADQANWPSTMKKPYSDEVDQFIRKAMAAAK